ncbi:vacuolar protein sorting-associated protein 35 [Phakopsora pachyrhizi]|nr:vacuolar protein sorting-associated protein 35 [Phakopsora pachyrhizi]
MTRDHLPIGSDPGPSGNLHDSLGFVLTNFIEMNKLWVRLQHQGLSRDRERREMERKELRILVGTNLVRLSQLEGVDLDMYQRMILPAVLEQVVNCKDIIAQEYLMEVVIQVFTDDFHLRTLGPFLSATAQLHPKVNIKQIVIALIDRLAAYAAREAENESPEETRRQEEDASRRLAAKIKAQKEKRRQNMQREEAKAKAQQAAKFSNSDWGTTEEQEAFKDVDGKPPVASTEDKTPVDTNGDSSITSIIPEAGPSSPNQPIKKLRGIPVNVPLFEVFWHQVVELIRARPDLSIQDVTALLVSLTNLALSCYPDRLEYVDQVLGFAKIKVQEHAESPDLHHPASIQNLLSLLLAPINSYLTVLTLLALPNFQELLLVQPFLSRRAIGHSVVASILKNETHIADPVDCKGVLDMCHVLVRDQRDAGVGMPTQMGHRQQAGGRGQQAYDPEEMAEEQGWLARMVHLLRNNDLDLQAKLLQEARKAFSEGGDRIRWTYPPLAICALKLARRYTYQQNFILDWEVKITSLFKWIHQVLTVLYNRVESSEICLRLYLQALQSADAAGLEELAYEFAVQAFTIYEESISESRAQLQAIVLIISALQGSRVFGAENYDTLITKAALHGAKLLKKSHQATAVALASHLWWQTEKAGSELEISSDKDLLRDGKRVLECLQKSLRIATSSIDELTSVQLYCDALDQYIYYFERTQLKRVSTKHLNSLVELITSNLDSIQGADGILVPNPSATNSGIFDGVNTPESVLVHFRNQLKYIQARKDIILNGEGEGLAKFEEIDIMSAMIKVGLQP